MHGNCFVLSSSTFFSLATIRHRWIYSQYSLVNRIVRTINLFQRSKNGFVIYRLSFWVTGSYQKKLCLHTDNQIFDGCRKLKTRGSPVVYLEYMDGGCSPLGIFRRGKWYNTSTCTELSVLSKSVCIADLFSLLSIYDGMSKSMHGHILLWPEKYMETTIDCSGPFKFLHVSRQQILQLVIRKLLFSLINIYYLLHKIT